MAVSKLHLKNNNKDYKLKATDRRTKEGRIIYENTKTGEFHSELSMTLEVPEGSGNWINVPSLINGRVYNIQGVLDMLEAGKVTPNSTGHKTEAEAVEAAIYRSNNLQDEVGVSLKSNNEVDLKNNDQKIVRAYQPAYTSGKGANESILAAAEAALAEDTAKKAEAEALKKKEAEANKQKLIEDYDPVKQAFIDENVNRAINPERYISPADQKILDDVITPKPIIDINQAANQQILGTDAQSIQDTLRLNELAAMTKNANMASRHPEGKGYWASIFDLDRLDGNYPTNEIPLNPDAQHIRDATGYQSEKGRPPRSGSPAIGSGIPALRGEALAEPSVQEAEAMQRAYFGPGTPPGTNTALRGEELAESGFNQGAGTMQYAQGDNITIPKGSGISTLRGMELAESRFNEDADAMQPYQREYKSSKIKGSGIPVLRGEEKAEKLMPKNVKPYYGEMPGFKLPPKDDKGKSTGNYWSVDETSPFWQTDAGYEKAMQVWGEKPGWVKPGYRPKKKELDINAIKKWFTPSK